LTQRGAQPAVSCPACGSSRFTSLSMTLTDGTPADFLSCHTCEHKVWSAGGAPLPFTDVLRRATKTKLPTG
jgi:hypothetical protein